MIVYAPNVTKYHSGPERFIVKVLDHKLNPIVNQTVTIKINNVSYNRITDENGTTSIALKLNSESYDVITNVNDITVYSIVSILSTVNGSDVVKIYKNGTQYYATFLDVEGKFLPYGTLVKFNINGVMYNHKVCDNQGRAELNINLPAGNYIITAMNLVTSENTINNITVISNLVDNKDIIKYYRNGTQYTVKVLGSDGRHAGPGAIVTFNINGVIYTRESNASGIVKLNINLGPGDYTVTAQYGECKVSNKITVLPVLTAKDITMKYLDGTQFKANLVDGQGKPYAGQYITFNINGIFYSILTDSNGQAALNIRLPPGEYIITSSFNSTNIANKITITS